MRISEAFTLYLRELKRDGKAEKTLKNHNCAMNSILRAMPDIPIALFNQQHVAIWKDSMLEWGNKSSSMARNISCLRGLLKYLQNELDMQVLAPGKVKGVTVEEPHREFLEIPEVQQMLDVTDNLRDRAILACLFSMGCRISELLNLNRDQIAGNEVVVHGKGDKPYPVFIDATARRCLDEYLKSRKDTLRPLFVSGQSRRITVSRVEQIIHVIADKAGIDKIVTPHVYRRTHATDLFLNGANMREVQSALNHSRISTTEIYVRLPDDHRREVQRRHHTEIKV